MTFRKSSYFHGRNINDDTYVGSFEGEFTGSVNATIEGEFTGTLTGSVTGAVAVLSSGSGKAWQASIGSDQGGLFNANLFTLSELGARFGALVDEFIISPPLPPPPPTLFLPSLSTLTLYFDTREQGDIDIIDETINNLDMRRVGSGSFTYRQDPPSVDLEAGVEPRHPIVQPSIMRANTDGVQTMMILVKPESITDNQYLIDFVNNNNIVMGFVDGQWEWFAGALFTGDNPRTSTQMPATASVWQTVCYTIDVDGANKQNGYVNGQLSIGPLNKSFDLSQAAVRMDIGHGNGGANFTGSFGAYLQWTSSLSAAEVAEAHNFLRSTSVDYGLPEA